MPSTFKYKAIDQQGHIRNDVIDADNVLELEQRLSSMGFDLITCKEKKSGGFGFQRRVGGVTRKDLINFTFQMQQMTNAGVPILEGLADLRDSLPTGQLKDVLAAVIDDIQGGKTFSASLAEHPSTFDNVYVMLVKVGEESGRLSEVLQDMAETLKWQDEMVSHTRKIMIYPTIVSVVVLAVVTFLMTYLLPQLVPFIKDMGGEIPLHTRALIATSNFMVDYWYLVFGMPIAAVVVIKNAARRNADVRYRLDMFKLKIWLFGPLLLRIKLARFANYMAMMYASGITVLESLKISKDLVDNHVLKQAIVQAGENIAEGDSISESFARVDLFPAIVIRMIRIGENTGALDKSLLNVSYFYNREVREAIEKLEPAISPVLTVILGTIMLWIMLAVLGPIYDTISTLDI